MYQPAITGHGVFTPPHVITNDELVASDNTYTDRYNASHSEEIKAGKLSTNPHSTADFI